MYIHMSVSAEIENSSARLDDDYISPPPTRSTNRLFGPGKSSGHYTSKDGTRLLNMNTKPQIKTDESECIRRRQNAGEIV